MLQSDVQRPCAPLSPELLSPSPSPSTFHSMSVLFIFLDLLNEKQQMLEGPSQTLGSEGDFGSTDSSETQNSEDSSMQDSQEGSSQGGHEVSRNLTEEMQERVIRSNSDFL